MNGRARAQSVACGTRRDVAMPRAMPCAVAGVHSLADAAPSGAAAKTLFDTAGKKVNEALQCWSLMTRREFYFGELETVPDVVPNFRFTKTVGYPVSLTRLVCDAPIGYRRSWEHIRRDPSGLRVLWFVRRGAMDFVRSGDRFRVDAGQFGLIDCNLPFIGRICCDDASTFESVQVIVPSDIFLDCIGNVANCSGSFPLQGGSGDVVRSALDLLWRSGESLAESTREALVRALLCAIEECIQSGCSRIRRAQSVVECRVAEIEQYILMHLSDPNLSAARVASSCGVSARYLVQLMKERNGSYSEFVWKNRLPRARDNLVSSGFRERSISEIAFMSGFKSAAHFCRMFKAAYGCTPSAYRLRQGAPDAQAQCDEPDCGAADATACARSCSRPQPSAAAS